MRVASVSALTLLVSALQPALSGSPETRKHVLVVHSFGRDFTPFAAVASGFEAELAQRSPGGVEFFEVAVELSESESAEAVNEAPLVGYLEEILAEQPMDLLVAIGGPATRFCLRHREDLFASTPLLAAGVDRRWLSDIADFRDTAAVPVALDPEAALENILHVLPETEEILVVLGGSALSTLWVDETNRGFQRFSNRVRLTWTHEMSLEELEERVAELPPGRAIFLGELNVDVSVIPRPGDTALERLHAVSKAPIFGLFDTQLGKGIVGGPLLSVSESGERAASVALRLLDGDPIASVETAPVGMSLRAFDARELERWGIPEARLPAGSVVRFHSPSPWDANRGLLLVGFGIVGLQTALIGGLLVQGSRRRVAEDEASALARRLLTAHEDERRRLARDLHDDLSQRLAVIALDCAKLEWSLGEGPQKDSAIAMRAELTRLAGDVHALSDQLHSSVLDELGLRHALELECERFSSREPIRAELTSYEVPSSLPGDVSVCLFRIAQEALRNAARHSQARTVSLSIACADGRVRMLVRDDGVGFDPARQRARQSLGHASMKERVALLKGTVGFMSAPGQGTTVEISVPLAGCSP